MPQTTRSNASKEPLGGPDGKSRCECGRLRYPRYKQCPACYYAQKDGVAPAQSPTPTQPDLKQLSRAELLKMRPPTRMPLPDRHERIRFLEERYGETFKGQEIRYMRNPQLYAISQQAGYRRR